MNINSHFLKLTGKAELPEAIDIGHNYHISVSGSVTSTTLHDNEDGTGDMMYTFRPIKVELLNALGKTLKLKDTRRNSEKLRFAIKRDWNIRNMTMNQEEFYDLVMNEVMLNVPILADQAMEKFNQDKL